MTAVKGGRTMYAIGVMPMPADFKYAEVMRKGKPQHERFDPFSIKHPKMDHGKRAKIFAPFDALRGFNFAISRKEIIYVDKPELSYEDETELNRRLDILHNLTFNSHMARQNRPNVTATVYSPCSDEQHDAFGQRGTIDTITGICRNVDPDVTKTIRIENNIIPFDRLISITCQGDFFNAVTGGYGDVEY